MAASNNQPEPKVTRGKVESSETKLEEDVTASKTPRVERAGTRSKSVCVQDLLLLLLCSNVRPTQRLPTTAGYFRVL